MNSIAMALISHLVLLSSIIVISGDYSPEKSGKSVAAAEKNLLFDRNEAKQQSKQVKNSFGRLQLAQCANGPSVDPIKVHSDSRFPPQLRQKRRAEFVLSQLQERYRNCRQIRNDESCDQLYERIDEILNDLSGKFIDVAATIRKFQSSVKKNTKEKANKVKSSAVLPNRSEFVGMAPKIHEDISEDDEDKFWNIEKLRLVENLIQSKEHMRNEQKLTENGDRPAEFSNRDTNNRGIAPLKATNFGK